jgi:RimJ/RimL family protein N-acetyltransferase
LVREYQFRVNWRADRDGDIDVSVSSESRGAGYGAVLIKLGASHILAERGERLHAFVKVENQSSRRAFQQAGFTNLGEESVDGHPALHFIQTKERDSFKE